MAGVQDHRSTAEFRLDEAACHGVTPYAPHDALLAHSEAHWCRGPEQFALQPLSALQAVSQRSTNELGDRAVLVLHGERSHRATQAPGAPTPLTWQLHRAGVGLVPHELS